MPRKQIDAVASCPKMRRILIERDARLPLIASSKLIGRGDSSLRLNKNDWAIGGQHLGRDHLGLERRSEVVYRRPVGVIVDDAQPQRGIPLVAGQCSRDVMCLLGVRLGAKARSEVTVWLTRIDVKAHVNGRQRDARPRQRRLVEAEKFGHLASISGAL